MLLWFQLPLSGTWELQEEFSEKIHDILKVIPVPIHLAHTKLFMLFNRRLYFDDICTFFMFFAQALDYSAADCRTFSSGSKR